MEKYITPIEHIERKIYVIRGYKVMLDSDLAELYGVATKVLNQAVKRNLDRFPNDFMFQISKNEIGPLNRSQTVTGSQRHRDPKLLPYAFTEHGVAMISSILRSKRAVQMNILIVRAFIALREMLASHKDLTRKIEMIEEKQRSHGEQLASVVRIVKQLIDPPPKPKRKIGFNTEN